MISFTSNSFIHHTTLGPESGFRKLFMLRAGYTLDKKDKNAIVDDDLCSPGTLLQRQPDPTLGKSGKDFGIDYGYRSTKTFDGTHTIGVRSTSNRIQSFQRKPFPSLGEVFRLIQDTPRTDNKMSKITYLTEEGLKKLQEELNHLRTVERPGISRQIAEARDKGDLSENAEYDAAKDAQGLLELKISKMEELVASVRIIDESKLDTSKVSVLCKVKIRNTTNKAEMTYTLVAENEADLKSGKISRVISNRQRTPR